MLVMHRGRPLDRGRAPSKEKCWGWRSSPEGTGRHGNVRPADAAKNSESCGEDETTVLCRARNEAKEVLGDYTDAMGRASAKAGFWKMVADRMWEKGFNRDEDQCKGKFHQVMDFYRRLKIHEKWSGLPSYWDMNQTKRKRYNVDFVLRRSWYDVIDPVEKDTYSISLSQLRDPRAQQEAREEAQEKGNYHTTTEGLSEEAGGGSSGGAAGGNRGSIFYSTLGKRKRVASNARETSMKAVTGAMRDHTIAVTRSDRECAKMRCDVARELAIQQLEAQRQTVDKDIAARERVASIMGGKVENGYMVLADAIRSLRSPRNCGGSTQSDCTDSG
ncbi:hypothetical protein CBR_g30752 [Chara braunii]|uniref:Myb/SANT-like DNA-binding domain-containing protein n=1 Tax=Chara braunii TaxID=69332 RepID=A0A388LDK0_CHABU|nr:hypothetical protein CBR_g30752 [Chara braunii]|eukprot:GBG80384.1 hypothetical protein CBR_g30752 [Chara braunii]